MEKDSEVQIEATGPGGKASNSLTVDDPDAGLSLEEKKLKVKLKVKQKPPIAFTVNCSQADADPGCQRNVNYYGRSTSGSSHGCVSCTWFRSWIERILGTLKSPACRRTCT